MSEPSNQSHRLLLELRKPNAVSEIVFTEELSGSNATVLMRRTLEPDSTGFLESLETRLRVPCRVRSQDSPQTAGAYRRTHVEISCKFDFWKFAFKAPQAETPAAPSPPPAPANPDPLPTPADTQPLTSPSEIIQALPGRLEMAQLLSFLVLTLESKGVFTRHELVGALKTMSK